jgi:hypothetical protein
VPELPIILNHIGALNRVGMYANREDEVRAAWRAGIAAVAACPNITLKLGGMGMPRMGFDWHTRAVPIGSEELAEAMSPWLHYCIEQFGPERCMFESNFPPDKVSFSYNVLYNAFKRLSRAYSPAAAPGHPRHTRLASGAASVLPDASPPAVRPQAPLPAPAGARLAPPHLIGIAAGEASGHRHEEHCQGACGCQRP